MNERIRELAKQATTEEHDGFRYLDKQKFAQLIIQECAEHLHRRGVEGFGILEERTAKDLQYSNFRELYRKFREHIGVRESVDLALAQIYGGK